jgi:hypothetical protein
MTKSTLHTNTHTLREGKKHEASIDFNPDHKYGTNQGCEYDYSGSIFERII